MDTGRLGGDVELLERFQLVLPGIEHLAEALLFLSLRHGVVWFVNLDCGGDGRPLDTAD